MTLDLSNEADVAAASDEQFAEAVKAYPWFALQYKHACVRLSDKQFATAAAAEPYAALAYKHACARLSEAQFAEAAKDEPYSALEYEHACARLSDKQFARAIKICPGYALEFEHVCVRLSDAQFADAVQSKPKAALRHEHACVRLSDKQFASAVAALDDEDYAELCDKYPHIVERRDQIFLCFNETQQFIVDTYCGGDMSHVTAKTLDDCGDTLLTFLVREAGDVSDPIEYMDALNSAIDQIERIKFALIDLKNVAPAP